MNACQIRVITNGYIVVWMNGPELNEYCFLTREGMKNFIEDQLDFSKEEE